MLSVWIRCLQVFSCTSVLLTIHYSRIAMNLSKKSLFFLIATLNFLTSNAQNFPSVFDQNTLNGKNGFIVKGLNGGDRLGSELSFVGDINHDGLEDIAINTQFIEPNNLELAGTTYIIFGSVNAYPSPFDLTTLNGINGFKVEGVAEDERRGASIGKLGDINGDGIDDIALASQGDKHMFLYGRSTGFSATITMNEITATIGFIFTESGVGEIKGAGDVNGDGINDILLGQYAWSGTTYILFGRNSNFPLDVDASWLDGTRGFKLGKVSANISAFYVASAGDINADGYADVMVGIWTGSSADEKKTYVYFGHAAPFQMIVDIKAVNGTNGFSIQNASNNFLIPVGTLGDINGDGIDDCFSGNIIIYGSKTAFAKTFVANGTNGFASTGFNLTSAAIGDVSDDGIDDFLVVSNNYENWVVYGSKEIVPATFDPTILNGTGGFKIKNIKQTNIGRQISGGGDINGDGYSDFMIGSEISGTVLSGGNESGEVYVVFGGDHYAKPLTASYPKVTAINYTTFNLQVNTQEGGSVHYGIYPSEEDEINIHSDILNGINALQFGNIQADQAEIVINKSIADLASGAAYDVYLYFQDAVGNLGEIYLIHDVKTLVDIEAPVITCPTEQKSNCGIIPSYTSLITVTDNADANPIITQSPLAGSVFNPNMTVTITAEDKAGNKSECSFLVLGTQQITCAVDQSLNKGTLLPDFTQSATTTGFCNEAPIITQTPDAGTLIQDDIFTVTLTALDINNMSATCDFVINTITTETDVAITSSEIKLYPNPTTDVIRIEGIRYSKYVLIDNLGAVVMEGNEVTELNIAALKNGMYLILLYNEQAQRVAMQKISKK